MGSYPKCYSIIDCELNPQLKADPRVYEVTNTTMRHASITKKASKTNHELKLLRLEMKALQAIVHLPEDEKEDALTELDEALDGTELEEERKEDIEEKPKKKKFDDPEDALFKSDQSRATIQPTKSVLEYKIASLGFEPIGENGDQLMQDIGCY